MGIIEGKDGGKLIAERCLREDRVMGDLGSGAGNLPAGVALSSGVVATGVEIVPDFHALQVNLFK